MIGAPASVAHIPELEEAILGAGVTLVNVVQLPIAGAAIPDPWGYADAVASDRLN